jgi:dihydroorotate dehydrogenase electron transfer subunit
MENNYLIGRITARVVNINSYSDDEFRLVVESRAVASKAKPGQFVNLYLRDRSLMLPRPISISHVDGPLLTLVIGHKGTGTKFLSQKIPGEPIDIMGPLGNGFTVPDLGTSDADTESKAASAEIDRKEKSAILIGGGVGIPPLRFLASELIKNGFDKKDITVILGFRGTPFYTEPFEKLSNNVYVVSEERDGKNVVDIIHEKKIGDVAKYWYACGPTPMLKAVKELADSTSSDIDLELSLEERMGCGYGACVGCVIDTASGQKKVCKDGPVFKSGEVIL